MRKQMARDAGRIHASSGVFVGLSLIIFVCGALIGVNCGGAGSRPTEVPETALSESPETAQVSSAGESEQSADEDRPSSESVVAQESSSLLQEPFCEVFEDDVCSSVYDDETYSEQFSCQEHLPQKELKNTGLYIVRSENDNGHPVLHAIGCRKTEKGIRVLAELVDNIDDTYTDSVYAKVFEVKSQPVKGLKVIRIDAGINSSSLVPDHEGPPLIEVRSSEKTTVCVFSESGWSCPVRKVLCSRGDTPDDLPDIDVLKQVKRLGCHPRLSINSEGILSIQPLIRRVGKKNQVELIDLRESAQ